MPKTHEDLPLLTPADKERYKKNPLAKWVWRANPGACVDCVARDGRKYFYPDVEKLKRPHPNCKCKVVPVTEEAPETFIAKTLEGLKDTAFGTADALADIATSESWGKTASGTADAMDEVWDDPAGRAALVFAGATMLPGVIAGAQAAPGMFYGAMEMLPAGAAVGVESALPYIPQATDFVTSIPPYTLPTANVPGVLGSAINLGLEYYTNIKW